MTIEHRTRDKRQNADSLSKKIEFYKRLEQKQTNQAEIKAGFWFLDKRLQTSARAKRLMETLYATCSEEAEEKI